MLRASWKPAASIKPTTYLTIAHSQVLGGSSSSSKAVVGIAKRSGGYDRCPLPSPGHLSDRVGYGWLSTTFCTDLRRGHVATHPEHNNLDVEDIFPFALTMSCAPTVTMCFFRLLLTRLFHRHYSGTTSNGPTPIQQNIKKTFDSYRGNATNSNTPILSRC